MAEGLAPLTEHDSTLRDDLSHLQDAGRSRGAAVIDGLAGEEAAEMPVLWNVVRISWTEIDALRAQLRTLNTAPRPGGLMRPTHRKPAAPRRVS
ncbi:hypothetical protein [Streptomyces sp. NPDC059651]|uniref:hypothetical protein n=1 Tax=Streptomyces sp. NPDC059651 TaxID=3346897 RepID=UPI0036BC0BDF